MQQLSYYLLQVFTRDPSGGNALAVFVDAEFIPSALMRQIARELNLSETVFVLPPTGHAVARLRIFTPDMELPFAGHPTIGAACLLASLGAPDHPDDTGFTSGPVAPAAAPLIASRSSRSMTLEEAVGDVHVLVRSGGGDVPPWAQLTAAERPEVRPSHLDPARLGALLTVSASDIGTGDERMPAAAGASCGVPFLFIPLRSREALARCRLDVAEWQSHVARGWAPHVFAYTRAGDGKAGADVHGRMFAPAMGIVEDPATGAAATALAALLAHHAGTDGSHRWTLSQGVEMGRPSILELEADVSGGAVTSCRVAGHAVIVGVRELLVGQRSV